MPAPSRDRLARPVDISELYSGARRRVNLIVDEPGLRWAGLGGQRAQSSSPTVDSSRRRVAVNRRRVAAAASGQENRPPPLVAATPRIVVARRRGRRRSVLPSWYPRRPLADITHIVRAIERRRAEQQDEQAIETPAEVTNNPSASTPSGALLEHDANALTPLPAIAMKSQPTPSTLVLKIMDQIAPKENRADSEFITPQKRLLNSIEKVREVWLAEQKKFESTPAAKKAQREQKMRVLMSMR